MKRFASRIGIATIVAIASGCSVLVDTSEFDYGAITADAGPAQVVSPSAMVTLDASGSTQSAGKRLTFRWEQTSGTPVTLATPTAATTTFTAPATIGMLEFMVHVDDGAPGETTDTVQVQVDSTPVLSPGPDLEAMTVRTTFLDATKAFDPDGEAITFTWTQTSGPAVTITGANSPVASFVTPRDKGNLTFHVEACDAALQCATDDIAVVVYKWTKIVAGRSHALALRSDGTAWGWGNGSSGELGSSPYGVPAPARVNTLTNVVDVYAGEGASYTKTMDGTLYAQGTNYYGSLGVPNPSSNYYNVYDATPVDAPLQGARAFSHVWAGALFITAGGQMLGTGYNNNGELGTCSIQAYTYPTTYTVPLPVGATAWTNVWLAKLGNPNWAIATADNNYGYAWGKNISGSFGNNSAASTTCATTVQNNYLFSAPRAVATGTNFVVWVTGSGSLYSWGAKQGDLGNSDLLAPVVRGNNNDWTSVAATAYGAGLAVRENGYLYAWGEGSNGELGLGDDPPVDKYPPAATPAPFRVGTDVDWAQVAAGDSVSLGLKTDGTIWSWGSGGSNLLGTGYVSSGGSPPNRLVPTRIADRRGFCGDGYVATGLDANGQLVTEACDDGPRNGSPGACSASCRCPATRVVYVDADATGSNGGTSWANAFRSVQTAIDLAGSCDTIWVAEGTYHPPASPANAPIVTMTNGSEIYGGFDGSETMFAQRDPARNPTIFDGSGTSYHVVVGGDGGVLDGFTVRGGNAAGTAGTDDASGGGLLLVTPGEATFLVADVLFTANTASEGGGAIFARDTVGNRRPVVVVRSRLNGNSSLAGGAIYIDGAQLKSMGSTYYGNRADHATLTGRNGGAIYLKTGSNSITLANNTFVMNSATDAGSAIWSASYNGSFGGQLSFLTVYGNTGGGAAVHFDSAPDPMGAATLNHSALWNPGSASESFQLAAQYSCFPTAQIPSIYYSIANVAAATDPFSPVGTGDSVRPYLLVGGPCRDIGVVATASSALPLWQSGYTSSDMALDSGLPDAGYHWFGP